MNYINQKLLAAVFVIGLSLTMTVRAEEKEYQTFSLTAEAGSTGLGGSLGIRFSDHLGLRVGGHFLDFDYDGEVEGEEYTANLDMQSIPVAIDIFTSKKGSFRITCGALLNNKFDFSGTTPITQVELNGNTYNSALSLELEREDIAPFITIGGTLYFNDKKNIGLSFEGGVAYMGEPDITLTSIAGDPLAPADVAAEIDAIKDSSTALKFHPIFKIGFTVSF